jgi:hypothetical protein
VPDSVPFTVLTSDWANAVQAELLNVIAAANLSPDKANQAQLLEALRSLGRIKLTADLNLYVATTGSDSNDGLSSGSPFLTLNHASYVAMNNYDQQNRYRITINVADGTYDQGASVYGNVGNYQIYFKGNSATPANCVITLSSPGSIFGAAFNANLSVDGFKLGAPTGSSSIGLIPGNCLAASLGGNITFANVNFGVTQRSHMETGSGGYIAAFGDYTISGSSGFHMIAGIGEIAMAQHTVTLTGTPAFSYFAWASAGYIYSVATTYTGSATGARYLADFGGGINTGGGGASYFPGNSSGISTTGYYQ